WAAVPIPALPAASLFPSTPAKHGGTSGTTSPPSPGRAAHPSRALSRRHRWWANRRWDGNSRTAVIAAPAPRRETPSPPTSRSLAAARVPAPSPVRVPPASRREEAEDPGPTTQLGGRALPLQTRRASQRHLRRLLSRENQLQILLERQPTE